MLPASEIIQRCGGFKAVADRVGLDRSSIQRWTYPAPDGLNERIPVKHWAAVMDLAIECGWRLSVADLAPDEVMARDAALPRKLSRAR